MASRRTQRWLPVAFAATVGFALIAGSYTYVSTVAGDRSGCVVLDVVSSTEKSELVKDLAERYNGSRRRFGDRCADVAVTGLTSGQAMQALAGDWGALSGTGSPRPQVWLPTSTLWTGQLQLLDQAAGHQVQTGGEYESIANSPLVIAMPAAKARYLQQQGPLGWGDILGMSGEQGWASFGKPEWKRFTFGKDNPNLSTSGLAATIATYYAATNTSSDLTTADLRDPKVTRFVRQIEANVSHYSDDVVDLLRGLAEADLAGNAASDLSAIVTQEELVYLYNKGELSGGRAPNEPLVAMYPKEGTFNLDHPYVVLPQADVAQRAAAADFLAFLQDDRQQRDFAAIGFRDHERAASDDLVKVVGGNKAAGTLFEPPSPEVVQGIKAGWATLRKKANILMAVDVSGSMTSNKVGNSQTRLAYATAAAKKGIELLNSEDRVGLWAFSSKLDGGRLPYREQLPLSRLDDRGFGAKLDAVRSGGGTALYTTVRAAQRHMLDNYNRTRINAVVVLTDGENEYPQDNDLAKLLRDIELDPDRPVKVFCIAFDKASDLVSLQKIAAATGGKAFDARDPAKIDEAFVKLLSSF
ncbi:vWA domain-containing protein [Catellatospora coxensis]|uniref:VWA domain-containing protein n=1 Tax=Catellatospora coxensis TaxID=310354 RepID=A0A8J3LAQ4_9ACTN|nr:extracellular solute-binding protein [Catellatospora coxensis]GIG11140.1 VWA domain-containing protein [Catellatospora coxensis]